LNILFLSELLYPHGGGAELATSLYAKLLTEQGINVRIVTNLFPYEKERTKSGNLEIYRLRLFERMTTLKYSMFANFPLLLSKSLRELVQWADIVYIPLYWYSAIPFAKTYRKRVVVHLHNYILSCPLGTLYKYSNNSLCQDKTSFFCPMNCIFAFEKVGGRRSIEVMVSSFLNSLGKDLMGRLASLCDAVVCVSEAQKQFTMQTCTRSLWEKLHVAYNPLPNLSYIDSVDQDFGYFGGDNPSKGFYVLYKAAEELSHMNLRKVAVHATKFQNVSDRSQSFLRKAGFILYDKLDEAGYEDLYRHISAVVVPSIWQEPLPYVVTEALLRGRLVVASRIGGIPEIVEGCNGVQLFQPGNSKQLAEKMLNIEQLSKEEVFDLGMKNRQIILKRFNNERIVRDFINIITNNG